MAPAESQSEINICPSVGSKPACLEWTRRHRKAKSIEISFQVFGQGDRDSTAMTLMSKTISQYRGANDEDSPHMVVTDDPCRKQHVYEMHMYNMIDHVVRV